ncbi:hypothetical protein ACFV0O_22030 [Kitasatospora sp. NPDC059577]
MTAFEGRLVRDPDTRIATVDGREARLTRADATLLRGLIDPGRARTSRT